MLSIERSIELINNMINHLLVAEKLSTVIRELLFVGFTKEELINEFNFNEIDIEEAEEEEFDED